MNCTPVLIVGSRPRFGGEKDFEKVFELLDRAFNAIVEKIQFEEKT